MIVFMSGLLGSHSFPHSLTHSLTLPLSLSVSLLLSQFISHSQATHKKTMRVYAVKVIEVELASKSDKIHLIINELSVLRSTQHPSLVQHYDSYMKLSKLYLVLEYCEAGSLGEILDDLEHGFTEEQVIFMTNKVLWVRIFSLFSLFLSFLSFSLLSLSSLSLSLSLSRALSSSPSRRARSKRLCRISSR